MSKEHNQVSLLTLFFTFFRVGSFTFGGGYVMLTVVENIVVKKKSWINSKDFWDIVAIVQSIPGVFAVNTALIVGEKLRGKKGGICAALGAILPSIIIILLIVIFFNNFMENPVVQSVFKGIKPCVVALILVPAIKMFKTANITIKTIFIPILSIILVSVLGVSPIYVIVVSVVGGILYGYIKESSKLSSK